MSAERSTPISGPLSVTPLYTSSGDDVVWWDGAQWNSVSVGAGPGGGIGEAPSDGTGYVRSNTNWTNDQLYLNRNTAAMPPALSAGTPGLWVNFGNTDAGGALLLDSYGTNQSALVLRQAGGTGASRTQTALGTIIGGLASRGFDGVNYSGSGTARLYFQALESFSSGAQGTAVVIDTNPPLSTSRQIQATIGPGVSVGSPTPPTVGGPMVAGDLNVQNRLMINGVAVGTGSGGLPAGGTVGQLMVNTSPGNAGWNSGGIVIGTPPDGVLGAGTHNQSGMLQINPSTLVPVASPIAGSLRVISSPSVAPRINLDSFGGGGGGLFNPTITFSRAGGTAAAPLAVPNTAGNSNLGQFTWFGYTGAAYSASYVGQMGVYAYDNFSTTTQGTIFSLATVASGGVGPAVTRMATGPLGGLLIYNASGPPAGGTAGDMGPGTINAAAGLYIGGTVVGTGGGSGTVSAGGASPQIALYTGSNVVSPATLSGDATIAAGGALTLNPVRAAVMPAHTGDVTSPAGSIVNTIAANAVTYPKMQAMTANRLLGSGLSGTAVAEIVLGTNLSFTGTTLNASGAGGGLTSVGLTVPASSLFAVTGSPLVANGNLGLTTTGTSGGVPYFNTANTLNTSALLTQHAVMLGGGAGAAPYPVPSTPTSGYLLQANGAGADPSWVSVAVGGGTVTSAAANLAAWYAGPTAQAVVSGLPTVSYTAAGSLTINRSGIAAPPAVTGTATVLQLVSVAAGEIPNFVIDGVGGTSLPAFTMRRADGTASIPGPVASGDNIGQIGWSGFGATVYGAVTARISAFATASFNDTVWPTRLQFDTTEPGGTSRTTQAVLGGGAGLVVGPSTTAAAVPAAGDVNCMRVFLNGTGSLQLFSTGTFTALYGPDGSAGVAGLFLGSVGNANFYRQNAHTFQDRTGTTSFAALTTTGLVVGSPTAAAVPASGDVNCARLLINGAVPSFGGGADTVTPGITASPTLTQAGATVLASQFNVITTAATAAGPPYAGVALPAATVGGHCLVRNSGVNPISVYPANASGAQINTLGVTAPITVLTNSTAYFEAQSATQWFTVP